MSLTMRRSLGILPVMALGNSNLPAGQSDRFDDFIFSSQVYTNARDLARSGAAGGSAL